MLMATNVVRPRTTLPSRSVATVSEFSSARKSTASRHDPTSVEQAKAASDNWFRIPKYDVTPSKRLSIHLSGGYEHRQSKWTDSATRSLEELLPQILQEIELRADAAEAARLAAIAEAEERRRQWERAMDDATRDYAEACPSEAFAATGP